MKKVKRQAGNKFFTNPNLYWKETILHFHQKHFQLSYPIDTTCSENYNDNSNQENLDFLTFSKGVGLSEPIEIFLRDLGKSKQPLDHEQRLIMTKHAIYSLLIDMEKWEFLEKVTVKNTFGLGDFSTFKITSKGIDIALKLQEHKDNERRYDVTVSYTKKAFKVSIGAFLIALGSLYINYLRI